MKSMEDYSKFTDEVFFSNPAIRGSGGSGERPHGVPRPLTAGCEDVLQQLHGHERRRGRNTVLRDRHLRVPGHAT
jgi:hypothetical protein